MAVRPDRHGAGPGAQAIGVPNLAAHKALIAVGLHHILRVREVFARDAAAIDPVQIRRKHDPGSRRTINGKNFSIKRIAVNFRPARSVKSAALQGCEYAFLREAFGLQHGKGTALIAVVKMCVVRGQEAIQFPLGGRYIQKRGGIRPIPIPRRAGNRVVNFRASHAR